MPTQGRPAAAIMNCSDLKLGSKLLFLLHMQGDEHKPSAAEVLQSEIIIYSI